MNDKNHLSDEALKAELYDMTRNKGRIQFDTIEKALDDADLLADKSFLGMPLDEKLTMWKFRFGSLSPKVVYRALSIKGVPPLHIALDKMTGSDEGAVTLAYGSRHPTSLHLSFSDTSTNSNVLEWDSFEVKEGKQDSGTAKKIFPQVVQFVEKYMPQIELLRGIAHDVGGYAWVKFGCLPTKEAWAKMKDLDKCDLEEYATKLPVRKKLIESQLTPEVSAALDKIIASNDPKAIRELANWDSERKVIDPISGESKTIGKYFLVGTEWAGGLNFKDPEAMKMFWDYVKAQGISTGHGAESAR